MPSFEPALELSGVRLTTFSVSWIRRRAEGEGKFVSLDRLRLLSLDMVLLAEEKPDEEEVRLPSPGLGIILIFCSIPWPCCCFVPCFSSLVPFMEVFPLGGLTASMLARGLFRPDFSGIPSLPGLFRPDEDPPPAIFLGLFSWEPGSGIELTLAGEAGVEVTLGVCCFCCCLNLDSWKKRPRMAFRLPSCTSSGAISSTATPLANRKLRQAWMFVTIAALFFGFLAMSGTFW